MNTHDTYLEEICRRLDGLTPSQRETVLDDLRGHLADAADAGRSQEETQAALGTPSEIAQRSYEEFGGAPSAVDRAWRVLLWTATGTAVMLAAVVAFLMPSYQVSTSNGPYQSIETLSLVDAFGPGIALLALIPAVIAVAPLLVPKRLHTVTTLTAAIAITAFVIIAGFSIGGYFAPVAMLAWAAVITPWRLRIAGGFGFGWRLAAAAVVILPVLVWLGGISTGAIAWGAVTVIPMIISAALAVLIAMGYRAAGWAVAAFGAIALVSVILNFGMLALGVIAAGGLLLTVGLAHALGARR